MRSGTLTLIIIGLVGCGDNTQAPASDMPDAAVADGKTTPDAAVVSPLDGNRDRLLATYLAHLKSIPSTAQSNGLVGRDLANVCDLWTKLDPSSRAVFLTLTHRMQGSTLRDTTRMLDHVTKLYRVIGGQDATSAAPGSCGGDEYNRMIMSMDRPLHDALLAANTDQGTLGSDNQYDLADIPATSQWRDSQNPAGPHAPFDTNDDTAAGAPRAQAQYFKDPASAAANAKLGRMDVTDVVDPHALELDQVYDCLHNSNPQCAYVNYGPLCAQEPSMLGSAVYVQDYGDFEPSWKPNACSTAGGH
jgi:hypothetical protein